MESWLSYSRQTFSVIFTNAQPHWTEVLITGNAGSNKSYLLFPNIFFNMSWLFSPHHLILSYFLGSEKHLESEKAELESERQQNQKIWKLIRFGDGNKGLKDDTNFSILISRWITNHTHPIHTYSHTYTHTYMRHTHTHACTHKHAHAHTYIYVRTHHAHIHTYMHHINTHTYMHHTHMHVHT